MAKRMEELNGVPVKGFGSPVAPGDSIGDVRVRVDLTALAKLVGPKALKARGRRITLYGGAVTIEGFNVRQVAHDPVLDGVSHAHDGGNPNEG